MTTNDKTPMTQAAGAGHNCAHCGAKDCADHCPTSPSGEHSPRLEGALTGYEPDLGCCDVEIVCAVCGAEGHVQLRFEVDLTSTQWDTRAWRDRPGR